MSEPNCAADYAALLDTIRLRGAIASAIAMLCSDSNADVKRVVDDVIACIEHAEFKIIVRYPAPRGLQGRRQTDDQPPKPQQTAR